MSFKISKSNQILPNVSNKQVIYLGPEMKTNLSCSCQLQAFCYQVRNLHLETKQKNQNNDESTLGHNKIFDVRVQQTYSTA
jgi:hypothetical protein